MAGAVGMGPLAIAEASIRQTFSGSLAQKLFIRMKRPTPTAGPMRAATTIMTKGFATITLYPALNS